MWEEILKDANTDKATIRMLEEKIDELVDNISSVESYHATMKTLLEKGSKEYELWEGMIAPLQLIRITLEELDKYDFSKFQEKRKILQRAYNIPRD